MRFGAPHSSSSMNRKGSAVWEGGFKDGHGTISTESGVLSATPYSASRRFGEEKGTNPEELVGADQAKFDEAARKAKEGCPISKLLKADISMDARLQS